MYKNLQHKNRKGFTLVELIVSLGIIALISAVVFYNGRKFSDTIVVTSAAQEASLALRQAQSYGASVRDAGSGNFTLGYGAVFSTANPTISALAIVFKDSDVSKTYNGATTCSGSDECVEKIFLRNGAKVTSVCAANAGSPGTCVSGTSMNVTFIRPSLDATITLLDGGGSAIFGGPWVSGQVTLQSPGGVTRVVTISITGQISVQ